MRRCLIILTMLLAGCGANRQPPLSPLALLDLEPCEGWTGPRPTSEGQFARAAAASEAGRLCANEKLATVRTAIAG